VVRQPCSNAATSPRHRRIGSRPRGRRRRNVEKSCCRGFLFRRFPELKVRLLQRRSAAHLLGRCGFETIVYLDESRFEAASCRQAIGERIGHKVYADRSGHKGPSTRLIAAKRGKRLIAPCCSNDYQCRSVEPLGARTSISCSALPIGHLAACPGCPLPHPDRKFSRLRLSASRGFK
jgi:hypothetical protein